MTVSQFVVIIIEYQSLSVLISTVNKWNKWRHWSNIIEKCIVIFRCSASLTDRTTAKKEKHYIFIWISVHVDVYEKKNTKTKSNVYE